MRFHRAPASSSQPATAQNRPGRTSAFVHQHHLLLATLVGAALILLPELVMGQTSGYGSFGSEGGGIVYYGNGQVVRTPAGSLTGTVPSVPSAPTVWAGDAGFNPYPAPCASNPYVLANSPDCVAYSYGYYGYGRPTYYNNGNGYHNNGNGYHNNGNWGYNGRIPPRPGVYPGGTVVSSRPAGTPVRSPSATTPRPPVAPVRSPLSPRSPQPASSPR